MSVHRTAVRAIGEVGIRVNDLDRMKRFYEEVVGLEVVRQFPNAVFFRINDGYKGHMQAFVLFDRAGEPGGPQIHQPTPHGVRQERSTLDHIAFEIDLSAHETEKRRLEQLGLSVESTEFKWGGWRSLYINDPEGNVVELVCFDPSIQGDGS